MAKTRNKKYTHRVQGSLWRRFSTWFSNLDRSDQIGMVLIALTGVGLLAMLFSGSLKNFLTLPGAEAKTSSGSGDVARLKGCEGFVGKIPGPTEPLDLVLIAERHDGSTKGCINAIAKSRGDPDQLLRVESVPNGQKVPCSALGYGGPGNRACKGWDDPRVLGISMAIGAYNGAVQWLRDFPAALGNPPGGVTQEDIRRASNHMEVTHRASPALCEASNRAAMSQATRQACLVVKALGSIAQAVKKGLGFKLASAQVQIKLEEERDRAALPVADRSLVDSRNALLRGAAGDRSTQLTFVVAGACHLTECALVPGGEKTRRAIERDAQNAGRTAVFLMSRDAANGIKKGNQQMRDLRDPGL